MAPTLKRVKQFVRSTDLVIHVSGGKLLGIGVKYGEVGKLKQMGFTRKEQIRLLNFLQKNQKIAKRYIGY